MTDKLRHYLSNALEAVFAVALLYLAVEFWRPIVIEKDINLVIVFVLIFVGAILLILRQKSSTKSSFTQWLVVLFLGAILLVVPGVSLSARLLAILLCGTGSYLFLRHD